MAFFYVIILIIPIEKSIRLEFKYLLDKYNFWKDVETSWEPSQ